MRSSARLEDRSIATARCAERRKDILFADDFLRRGEFLFEELPKRKDGWKQRWCSMRATVVQIVKTYSGRLRRFAVLTRSSQRRAAALLGSRRVALASAP